MHVDFYRSSNFTITIYKTLDCLKELDMVSTIMDFGECYTKVQERYGFLNQNLIILIADFFDDKKLTNSHFYFFNPKNGTELSIKDVCIEDKVTIEKSLSYYPEINIDNARFFEEQNINIFNLTDIFYTDLCYYYESPNGKDIPLKQRILLFYPNVILCEDNCNNVGVNLTSMKAICNCKLKELIDETKGASQLIGLNVGEILDVLSINVLKCYNTLFQLKYFKNCYGGFILLSLICIQTLCVIFAWKKSIFHMRKIAYNLIGDYSNLLLSKSEINSPTKKNEKKVNFLSMNDNMDLYNESKNKTSKIILKSKKEELHNLFNKNFKKRRKKGLKSKKKKQNKISNISITQANNKIDLKEYLKTEMDELDYDELLIRENRSFCKIFIDKLVVTQMIFDLFYNSNWIIPKSIKMLFFLILIDLYLVVNALFYNEEYITNLYYSDKEEKFFSFVPRSLNRIIYTSVASSILDFLISLLFPTENKIKKIMIRKKNDIMLMKNKVFAALKNIINNYMILILISYILTIISWYYISCFNNVYPYLKIEWIKSSIFIVIIMQLISIIKSLLFAFLRYSSIKCKSEKIYRISCYFFG